MAISQDPNQYQLISSSTNKSTSTTFKANHVSPSDGSIIPVTVKILDTYKYKFIFSVTSEIHEAETYKHENIVNVHCSFTFNDHLWIIMPPLSRLSLRSIIRSSFPNGLSEVSIFFVLKDTLEALNHMHATNKLHQNLDVGCIFFDSDSKFIKVALRSLTCEESYSDEFSGGYPSWTVAPELTFDRTKRLRSKESDVWMLGLLALELFYGRIPVSDFEEFKVLVLAIDDEFGAVKRKGKNRWVLRKQGKLGFGSCFRGGGKKIPEALGGFMAACLSRDPEKRATTGMLMKCEFLKKRFGGDKSLAKLLKAWTN
ncbi:hypothetical protein CASFOL_037509 [Castilleja foliolosa]|uniref:Protein kinase domain-containing protein n=1 Tax=Castilleja foliolosa TaxID=1961234 RepID=A0ABD3BMK0_9LAMI